MNYRAMCFNLGAILLCGLLAGSCSDDERLEEPPAFVRPAVPAVNPVDGVWIEENADELENGEERHLTFSSDFTYQQEIYSVMSGLLRTERTGSYETKDGVLYYDNDDVRKFKIENDRLQIAASVSGKDRERFYRRYKYSDGIKSASKLVLTSKGMLTKEELDAFKGYMMYNSALQVPTSPQYDNTWVFRALGKSMGACTRLFEITYDLTFLNRVIEYADAALYTRNGQPGGDFRIVGWTGEPNDIWPSTGAEEEKIDGAVEQGAVLARIAYCARLILQTPSIWNLRVAADDRYYYGTTYKKRAETYLRMCDEMYDTWLTRFVHPGDQVFYRRNSTAFIEPIAWNQALMACDGLTYMAQCHEILGNVSKVTLYDQVVRDNLEFFIKDSWTKISDAGTVCLQWRYSKVADKVRHAEDLNHASLVANVIYNIYLSGHHPYINDITEQLANTMFDIVFCTRDDQGRFPGRINGAYEGKYMDSYVRDDHMQLTDIRKDWYDKVLEINKARWPGNMPMVGRALWCKTRRLPAPEDITAHFEEKDQAVRISWKSIAEGNIRILHSTDLWNWEEVASVAASAGSYKDIGRNNAPNQYYRLVLLQGDDAGYSSLICALK